MSKPRDKVSYPRGARSLKLGDITVVAQGLRTSFWGDLYHHAMTVSWRGFFASYLFVFLLVNSAVATLYFLGDDPIANARPGNFLDYFFFSVETIATVGYGDMHPRTLYGHVVATFATFTGISMLAVTTGLIFARFSQPRARIMFARHPIVTTHEGARSLMIRFANERINAITDATAKLWLIRDERTVEGATFRKFRQLRVARDENPVFALSWTLIHVIDEDSPLRDWTTKDFEDGRAIFIVTLTGHDETSGSAVHGRWNYSARDIRVDHAYVDIIAIDEAGWTRIDFTRFHETEPTA